MTSTVDDIDDTEMDNVCKLEHNSQTDEPVDYEAVLVAFIAAKDCNISKWDTVTLAEIENRLSSANIVYNNFIVKELCTTVHLNFIWKNSEAHWNHD